MTRQPRGRLVQGLLAPRRHLLPQRLLDQLHLLVRIAALLRQLERHEPVHVGVRQAQDQLAVLALPASFSQSRVAHQRLRQPERQSLLPDTGWALKQEGLWQPAGGDGAYQPVSDPLMGVEGGDWHGGNLVWGGKNGRFAKCNALCTILFGLFLWAFSGLAPYPILSF